MTPRGWMISKRHNRATTSKQTIKGRTTAIQEMGAGRQAYIVSPVIEETEGQDLKAAKAEYANLREKRLDATRDCRAETEALAEIAPDAPWPAIESVDRTGRAPRRRDISPTSVFGSVRASSVCAMSCRAAPRTTTIITRPTRVGVEDACLESRVWTLLAFLTGPPCRNGRASPET